MRALALWLGEQGRQAEADRIHRLGIDAYGRKSRRILTDEVNRRAEPRMWRKLQNRVSLTMLSLVTSG